MTTTDSSYYPPRANALSRAKEGWRRLFRVTRFELAENVTLLGFAAGVFVPGLAYYLTGRRRLGWAAMGLCAVLLAVFLALIGYPQANAALGVLLSIHCVGLVSYFQPALAGARWPFRLVTALGLCCMTLALVYAPMRDFIENHWLMPLSYRNKVVVIRRTSSASGRVASVSLRSAKKRRPGRISAFCGARRVTLASQPLPDAAMAC
jgi:hypothetical protein